MKKSVAFLSLFVLLASANLAQADQGRGENNVRANIMAKTKIGGRHAPKVRVLEQSQFIVMGTVKSVSGSQFVITLKPVHRRFGNLEGDLTIKTTAETKISMIGDATMMTEFSPGALVIVKGERSGSEFVADWVQVKGERKRIAGEVTAKTDDSVTIKNNVTGVVTTVAIDDNTKVSVNGEAKTFADVQVGDKGFVKIKAVLGSVVAKFMTLFR